MLQPARRKFRKEQKGRNTGIATRGTNVSFGEFGLKATERGRIFIRIFPDKPISQKPAEVRMGNGKGNPEYFVCEIQPGKIIFEMDGVTGVLAKEAFALAAAKLPFRTIVVQRMLGG